jgi:hypothetical protein
MRISEVDPVDEGRACHPCQGTHNALRGERGGAGGGARAERPDDLSGTFMASSAPARGAVS